MSLSHLLRPWHWLLRIRHRCGYGIHSPFAFSFVTGVVYEAWPYYAYAPLRRRWPVLPAGLRRKDAQLLFRLANFCHPCGLQCPDAEGLEAAVAYLQAACPHAALSLAAEPNGSDMVVCLQPWDDCAARLLEALPTGGMLVLHRIHATQRRSAAWQRLLHMPQAQIAFDLRDFGIILHLPHMQRAHYVINYF